jgi:hypothetical protein
MRRIRAQFLAIRVDFCLAIPAGNPLERLDTLGAMGALGVRRRAFLFGAIKTDGLEAVFAVRENRQVRRVLFVPALDVASAMRAMKVADLTFLRILHYDRLAGPGIPSLEARCAFAEASQVNRLAAGARPLLVIRSQWPVAVGA